MVKQVTIKFFPRLDAIMEDGKIPIYVRVILDREKFEFSAKQTILKISDWDEVIQRVKMKSPLNAALSEIEHEVKEAYNFLKFNGKPLTVLALRNQLKGESNMAKVKLIDFVDDYYLQKIQDNQDLALATKKNYKSSIYHLKNFLEHTQKERIRVSEIDEKFLKEFDHYLVNRSIKHKIALKKNSANKYHVCFKTILFSAVDKKVLEANPYANFKFKSEPGRLTFLTTDELTKLEEYSLNNKSLERVRDIFLFSVYTGLRHSDATGLTKNNIEIDGENYWIVYKQQKTGEPNRIPMLKKAIEIYNKYKQERKVTGYVLPRLSHQKLNAFLKSIAQLVGINKPLTHHVARHTAATTIFMQNGISLETTGKMLGHRSIKSTQIYAKVTNLMLKEAADKLDKTLGNERQKL